MIGPLNIGKVAWGVLRFFSRKRPGRVHHLVDAAVRSGGSPIRLEPLEGRVLLSGSVGPCPLDTPDAFAQPTSHNLAQVEATRFDGDRPASPTAPRQKPWNVLFLTNDDLNYDSLGVTGATTPDITPNLDGLAGEGMLFTRAHVNAPVCQPSRAVLLTGRFPHRNGATGFTPIRDDVQTLPEQFQAAGYLTAIAGKSAHSRAVSKQIFEHVLPGDRLDGRIWTLIQLAKIRGQPFFIQANSSLPHPPFNVNPFFEPNEVQVPGFLPDIPAVREDVAAYYGEVNRADDYVGRTLKVLDLLGVADDTIVVYMSDHGMSFPFAKASLYQAGTRTPLIIRWPGVVKPGSVDTDHFVSGTDIMPTLLDAAGLRPVEGVDGRSFVPVLKGGAQAGRTSAVTTLHEVRNGRQYPTRAINTSQYSYIYNAWSNGRRRMKNATMQGATFRAMQVAAETDPDVGYRLGWFLFRAPQEFYDLREDPNQLNNRFDDPSYQVERDRLRIDLLKHMARTNDPLLLDFRKVARPGGLEPTTVVAATMQNETVPHQLRVQFSDDVELTLDSDDVRLHDLTNGQSIASSQVRLSYDRTTHTAAWTFNGPGEGFIPDGHYEVEVRGAGITNLFGIALDGDDDGVPGGDFRQSFDLLHADLDNDGTVGSRDLSTLLSNLGRTGDATKRDGDLTGDAAVTSADLVRMLSHFGTQRAAMNTAPAQAPQLLHLSAPDALDGTTGRREARVVGDAGDAVLAYESDSPDATDDRARPDHGGPAVVRFPLCAKRLVS